jgi:hypothetical protein
MHPHRLAAMGQPAVSVSSLRDTESEISWQRRMREGAASNGAARGTGGEARGNGEAARGNDEASGGNDVTAGVADGTAGDAAGYPPPPPDPLQHLWITEDKE